MITFFHIGVLLFKMPRLSQYNNIHILKNFANDLMI